jgi:hypothetical protein
MRNRTVQSLLSFTRIISVKDDHPGYVIDSTLTTV